jgi:hypothetical protein
MHALVGLADIQEWDLGHCGQGALVCGGLADQALADMPLNCLVHVNGWGLGTDSCLHFPLPLPLPLPLLWNMATSGSVVAAILVSTGDVLRGCCTMEFLYPTLVSLNWAVCDFSARTMTSCTVGPRRLPR